MALTVNSKVPVRSGSQGSTFGYSVAPGVHVFAGALVSLNAAGQLQPIQAVGGVAFAGMAAAEFNNMGNAMPSFTIVEARRGIVIKAVVPAATFASVGAAVYATDDNTLTLQSNSGANVQVGFVAGFEAGATWVRIIP